MTCSTIELSKMIQVIGSSAKVLLFMFSRVFFASQITFGNGLVNALVLLCLIFIWIRYSKRLNVTINKFKHRCM